VSGAICRRRSQKETIRPDPSGKPAFQWRIPATRHTAYRCEFGGAAPPRRNRGAGSCRNRRRHPARRRQFRQL